MSSRVNKVNNANDKANDGKPKVIIVEQPASKGLRFRYECEKKYAAPIIGVSSNGLRKTFPTIKILNWKKPVRVVVSCVTKEPPHRPHPHNILGKIKVADGICEFELEDTGPAVCFENLSIQCVKKKQVARSLAVREKLGIDPFKTGFDHAKRPNCIDMYSVRLCFQVFIEGNTPGVYDVPLQPAITDPIYDRRSKSEPEIVFITRKEGPVTGGDELGILCERVDKDDVDVLFYREESNWEEIAEFHKLGVFKRAAIVIKTPPYEDEGITEPVEVKILLRKITNGDVSDSVTYTYLPGKINPLKRKRDDYTESPCETLQEALVQNVDKVLPKNMDSCKAYNLPAREDKTELQSITDLSANAYEYSDPFAPPTKDTVPKNKTIVNNLHDAENDNGPEGEPENLNYSNTLTSDDWIRELLQELDDSKHNNNEPEVVKEPEIKYIIPDSMPNTTNSIAVMQNHNNFIGNNNNHLGTPSFNTPVFVENVQHLPQHFPRDLNTLSNIRNQREQPPVGIPQEDVMQGEHPQYAVNINGNQWSTAMNNVMSKQPFMPNNCQYLLAQQANIPQMCVDNNFNGPSGNYPMNNGTYGTPMQSFNQENMWHQIDQRETLDEFDPLCPTSKTWH